jgi:hypothetical protein
MPQQSAPDLAERLKTLLPTDGTPVLNRVARMMLARDLGRTITDAQYEQARGELFAKGRIGRLRGQGGQIFLAKAEDGNFVEEPADPRSRLAEPNLMPLLERYLQGTFIRELDLPKHGEALVKDVSRLGPPLGRWARPDYIVVTAMRFKIMPGAQLDVHSFELKAEFGATDLAVYEALAQTRFTHFGTLVWHLPQNSNAAARLPEMTAQCAQHGVGLIRILDPTTDEGFETVLEPIRKPTLASAVDGFLEQRLDAGEQNRLRAALHGAAA